MQNPTTGYPKSTRRPHRVHRHSPDCLPARRHELARALEAARLLAERVELAGLRVENTLATGLVRRLSRRLAEIEGVPIE